MADAGLRQGRKCAKGHFMDPSWETCPYCEAEQRSKQKTSGFEGFESSDRQKTRIESAQPSAGQGNRVTKVMQQSHAQNEPASPGDGRRIVGVLVTYTWHREGDLFKVYTGKNFIGRGKVHSEAEPRDCDIQIRQDREISEEHALILCRQGGYEILDQASANGTFLNGKSLKANAGTDLPNYAEIKTGATLWTFVRIQPSSAVETVQLTERQEIEPGSSEDRGPTVGHHVYKG